MKQKALETRLEALSVAFKQSPTPGNRKLLEQVRSELDLCLTEGAERILRWSHLKWYARANKPNRMLANRLRTFAPKFTPLSLRNRQNVLTGNPKRILEEFRFRLTKLYSAPEQFKEQDTTDFLNHLSIPILTEAHVTLMDQDIQVSEVLQGIKDLKVGKRPGQDGYTALYYRKLATVVAPHLTAMYNSVKNGRSFTPDLLTANIVMIPKPDHDHSSWPISLINVDMKLLTKILANRLNSFLPRLIGKDQVSFVPQRQAGDAIRRILQLQPIAHTRSLESMLLSLDVNKAFDTLSWPYFMLVLRHYGFGSLFMRWMSVLYDSPQAKIKCYGFESPLLNIKWGTRQGCPLSPLLFVLSLEPLAEAIRTHTDIRALK